MLRGEIPPSNGILCIFNSRLHDERNTTGIVKSHLTRGGISPGWGEIFPYKRNTTGMVRWNEMFRWFSLVSSFWFHGRETLIHLASQPRGWQARWKISYKQWLKFTSPVSPESGRWGVFPHINRPLDLNGGSNVGHLQIYCLEANFPKLAQNLTHAVYIKSEEKMLSAFLLLPQNFTAVQIST